MSQIVTVVSAPATSNVPALAESVPALVLPETFSVESATLGRQPNNDGDNSGAMWFE